MSQSKVQKNEEKFNKLYETVNNQLKSTSHYYTHGDKFYGEYSNFITSLSTTFESLKSYSTQNLADLTARRNQALANAKADEEFSKNSAENIKINTENLTQKTIMYDAAKSRLPETLQGLEVKKLGKLKVKDQTQLQHFFASFYTVFYPEATTPFDWAKFKPLMEKDKTRDFVSRLMNFDFSTLTQPNLETLEKVKDDPFYTELASNPKEGSSIAPLLSYLNAFVETGKAHREITDLEATIQNIQTSAPEKLITARKNEALAADLNKQIRHLEELNGRMIERANPFGDEALKFRQSIRDYEEHREKLRSALNSEYSSVQHVPRSVYSAT